MATVVINGTPLLAIDNGDGTFTLSVDPIPRDVTVTKATGSTAIDTSTALAAAFRLVAVTVHFNEAPATSERFVVMLDSSDGPAYDTVLYSVDPSVLAATDVVFTPDTDLLFKAGDEIKVTFPNTDARTYGLRIVTEAI